MFAPIILFLNRWRFAILGILWLLSLGFGMYKTYDITKTTIEAANLKHQTQVVEKRNEIANNRPDDATFFNGLLNDPNW